VLVGWGTTTQRENRRGLIKNGKITEKYYDLVNWCISELSLYREFDRNPLSFNYNVRLIHVLYVLVRTTAPWLQPEAEVKRNKKVYCLHPGHGAIIEFQ
jgi:hypothetical protein